MRSLLALLLLVAFLGVTGCGGGDEETTGTTAPAATAEPETSGGDTSGGGAAAGGEAVFASAGCGNCHTFSAAGATGNVGPNLDDLQPDAGTVEEQVRNGGGGMPAFEGQLSDTEIQAVAEYVAENAGQ